MLAAKYELDSTNSTAIQVNSIRNHITGLNVREIERKAIVEIQLHRQLDQLKALHEFRSEMMQKMERRYARLKKCANELRVELAKVLKLNLQLTGQASLTELSVSELESLESTLENGLQQIRQSLRQQYKDAIESKVETCIVCLTEKVSMVFLPCRHRVLCGNCALRVNTCPVDRKEIHDMFPTFGSI
ncbi:hypothetical protein THRCLA_03106 [Thraustotheca clavata]|uniref:RING-type domain-containing protein n=1 Tax=Thraustotheca clavata TaxID=74557 RepID=A0A1W0A3A9_9STRA|nr:hypothetical protein THRCLA_03106 [Thraustotheca clavata]